MHSALAQKHELNDVVLDSMSEERKKAYELYQQGRYGESIAISEKVLEYAKKTKHPILEGVSYNLLGLNHYWINNDTIVFDYLRKALEVYEKEKDTFRIISIYSDFGALYKGFDQTEKSNSYFKKAITLAKHTNDYEALAFPLANIAANELDDGLYRKSILDFKEALQYALESEDFKENSILSFIYAGLSYAYYKIGDKKNNLLYFNKGVVFAKKHAHLEALIDLYYDQSQFYAEAKNFKKAYTLSQESLVLLDSLNSIKEYEKAKQIEAKNFLIENREKLLLAEKEKEFQNNIIKRTRWYNVIFGFFILGLVVSIFLIYNKNKQLTLSKEKTEELSKAKSTFYSEISHELRTPLYAVIELSKLLLNDNVNSTHKEYLESLNFSGNHLLTLINNVLEINKIESGQIKVEILEFKLKNLINDIVESLEFALKNSHNKIYINYDDTIPISLSGDSLKLSQIFINLISNAIKFTRHGNIYVSAKLIENLEDKVKISFEVKDDGAGISEENQLKIFESFYQKQIITQNSYNNTGLGLSIVKKTLLAMDSDILIESEVDKGSTFSFELLFLKNDSSLSSEKSFQTLVQGLKEKYILIVDDNKINRLVTQKILNQFNIKCKAVYSGMKALSVLKEEKFDCILMDLHMPDIDGYETTSMIREFNKSISIIALTAASTEEVESKINDYQMNGYIMKPFLTSDFIETIHDAIVKKW